MRGRLSDKAGHKFATVWEAAAWAREKGKGEQIDAPAGIEIKPRLRDERPGR